MYSLKSKITRHASIGWITRSVLQSSLGEYPKSHPALSHLQDEDGLQIGLMEGMSFNFEWNGLRRQKIPTEIVPTITTLTKEKTKRSDIRCEV